jgi:hypothetical protein
LFEKTPIIVDQENGLENFDLLSPNEHLHNSEVICMSFYIYNLCFLHMNPLIKDNEMDNKSNSFTVGNVQKRKASRFNSSSISGRRLPNKQSIPGWQALETMGAYIRFE